MRILIFFCLLLIVSDACVDRINFDAPDVTFQLAVDGLITDEPGPYTVNIFRASGLDADLDFRVPVSLAVVTLSDDAGNAEVLKEVELGIYKTKADGIRGTVGRTYTLQIKTHDGKIFESLPEKMMPSAGIDNLSYEFEYREKITPDGTVQRADGFNVFMDANALKDGENLFRWKWTGTYEVLTFPQLKTRTSPTGGQIPDPYPCSGYEVRNNKLFEAAPCECCSCWVNLHENIPTVSDDQFIAGDKFRGINIAFIPVTRRTFYYDHFHLSVKQMSLSRTAYDFWRIIKSQKNGAASLFQPSSGKVRGNIFSKNSNELVQGIFYASSVKEKTLFIEKGDVPYAVPSIDTMKMSCKFLDFSTNVRPTFWK